MVIPAFRDKYLIENFRALVAKHGLTKLFETGTWIGESCQIASKHINKVYTVEIEKKTFEKAKERNKIRVKGAMNEVALFHGSSPKVMNEILKEEEEDWIFFLDAHWKEDWPLLNELAVIANKKIKPVILIHDFYVPDGNGGAKFRYDSYKGQPLDYQYIKEYLDKIYASRGYTYYYSDKVGEVDSALIYIEPKVEKNVNK